MGAVVDATEQENVERRFQGPFQEGILSDYRYTDTKDVSSSVNQQRRVQLNW